MTDPDKQLKICFVSPKAYPLFAPRPGETFGGAEVDLFYLGVELARDSSFRVSFITADYGQPEVEVHDGVSIIKSLRFTDSSLVAAVKIWSALRKADADMYMIKSVSPGTWLTALFCRLRRKIFLYRSAHSTHCDGTYIRKHPFASKLFALSLRQAAAVFVQNETDRDGLKRTLHLDSVVIPNGHLLRRPGGADRRTILWAGRSADFKRPWIFIDLAAKFSDEQFVMICQQATGDTNYGRLRDLAAKRANLQFIEHVPFNEIDAYFLNARVFVRVFVNTSTSEGFPNTFIQAGKCATPILSLNVNPDGFLDRYSCGICCGDDEVRLADSLRTMLDDQRCEQMGRSAREYVEANHDITKIVED